MAQKNSALTAATVQSASALEHNQDTANPREKQEGSLFRILSDIDCTATRYDELEDLLQLLLEGLEDEAPKGVNPNDTDCRIFAVRVRLYLSSLNAAWGVLRDKNKELNSQLKRGYEAIHIKA